MKNSFFKENTEKFGETENANVLINILTIYKMIYPKQKPMTTLLLITTIILITTSFASADIISNNLRSQPWITEEDSNNLQNDYANLLEEMKPKTNTISNETQLTPEEKEKLRIENNLEIKKARGELTEEDKDLLRYIEADANKESRKENKDFFLYAGLVVIALIMILWGMNNEGKVGDV